MTTTYGIGNQRPGLGTDTNMWRG